MSFSSTLRLSALTCGGVILALCASCAQQQVAKNIDKHVNNESSTYAREVSHQSPFKTVKMDWKEARELMKERNPAYQAAVDDLIVATQKESYTNRFTGELKGSIDDVIKGISDPKKLNLKNPIAGLPTQLSNISSLKDVSHKMQQTEWGNQQQAISAEKRIRQEIIKLQVLFAKGRSIDQEIRWSEAQLNKEALEPNVKKSLSQYQQQLAKDRGKWLSQWRDFFNAEYYDVKLTSGKSPMPSYRNESSPDLSQPKRWATLFCQANLTSLLKKKHKTAKPIIPGTNQLKQSLTKMLGNENKQSIDVTLKTKDVRKEVRTLIRSWREMKAAQTQQRNIKAEISKQEAITPQTVAQRKQLYQLANTETNHAKEIWLRDEACWKNLD